MTQRQSKNCSKSTGAEYTCTFCGRVYQREKSFLNHMCTKKQRFLERDTKYYMLAYRAYDRFYTLSLRKKVPSVEKFESSSVYLGFIRFGKYVLDINAVDPMEYVAYLVKHNIPLDDWCKDRIYEQHLRDLVLKESPDRALERNIMLMESWAHKNGKFIRDFFREIGTGTALQWIRSGRISPWVMFNCESGRELLSRFTDEQLMIAGDAINRRLWQGKFSRHIEYVHEIQSTLEEVGL